jgi:hypothetical protein
MIVIYDPVYASCDVPVDKDYIRAFGVVLRKLMQLDDSIPVLEFVLSAVELAVTLEIRDYMERLVLLPALPNQHGVCLVVGYAQALCDSADRAVVLFLRVPGCRSPGIVNH